MRIRKHVFIPLALAAVVGGQIGLFAPVLAVGEGSLTAIPLPSGLAPASEPAHYTPQTLFEIINGEADLYLKAGFIHLETRRFRLTDDSAGRLAMRVYHMADHRRAFAVYSIRRASEAVPDTVASYACRYRNSLTFVHGPYYVDIRAVESSDPPVAVMQALARAFVDAHAVSSPPVTELALFPPVDQVAHSGALQPSGAFGFEGFENLFTARYRAKGGEVTAFFHLCDTPADAAELADAYRDFLFAFDGEAKTGGISLPGSWLIRVMDTYTLVFTRGRALGGVQEAATPETAHMLARRLYDRLAAGHY